MPQAQAGGGLESEGASHDLQHVRFELHRGGLADKVEAQQDGGHAVTFFDPAFDALQGAGFDADTHPFANGRSQAHAEFRVQSEIDVLKLLLEGLLVEDFEEIRDVITLADDFFARGFELKKYIAGKKRFRKGDGFSAVLVR